MTAPTHYCTYCDFYSRTWNNRRSPGSTVFEGSRKQVMAHANTHPIGTPADMAQPLPRHPYADEETS